MNILKLQVIKIIKLASYERLVITLRTFNLTNFIGNNLLKIHTIRLSV